MAYITKTLFGRYKVWTIGHTIGDELCIAKFRYKTHAELFIESLGYTLVGRLAARRGRSAVADGNDKH